MSYSYIKEAKQAGKLYHFCAIEDFIKYVIPEDSLKSSGMFYNRLARSNKALSLTRNPNLRLNTLRSFDVIVRITLDGNKLSERYRILPYSAYGVSSPVSKDLNLDYDIDEMEEIIIGEIKSLHKYILDVCITFKSGYDDSYHNELSEVVSYFSKFNLDLSNLEIIDKTHKQKYAEFISDTSSDPNKVYRDIKDGDLSIIDQLDGNSLKQLFTKIILDIDDGYIYDLITHIGNNADYLTTRKKKLLKSIFIKIFKQLSPEEDLDDFIDGLDFYFND